MKCARTVLIVEPVYLLATPIYVSGYCFLRIIQLLQNQYQNYDLPEVFSTLLKDAAQSFEYVNCFKSADIKYNLINSFVQQ